MSAHIDETGELREMAFAALVGYAAKHGGGKEFFGDTADLARKAYRKSLIGSSFPSFWMEVPFAGTPGFDLHVYYDRGQVLPGERFADGCGFGMQAMFDWFFGEETSGVGVGFAHDLRDGRVSTGTYVNFNRKPLDDPRGFFASLGVEESYAQASALLDRLPEAWGPWYLGLFPERPGAGVRVGAFVSKGRQMAYALDSGAFADDLARVGFTAFDGPMLERLSALAKLPYGLELQFDTDGDGTGETLGVDLTIPVDLAAGVRASFAADGPGARACELLESWGAADGRWQHVAGAATSRLVPMLGVGASNAIIMKCVPIFIKVKWTAAELQPAKVYLMCAANPIGG